MFEKFTGVQYLDLFLYNIMDWRKLAEENEELTKQEFHMTNKMDKKISRSLIIEEIHTKTIIKHLFSPIYKEWIYKDEKWMVTLRGEISQKRKSFFVFFYLYNYCFPARAITLVQTFWKAIWQ